MTSGNKIAVLAQEHAYPFELGIPTRIFGAADAGYEVRICTPRGEPIMTNAGFAVAPGHGPGTIADADTVIIPPIDPSGLRPELTPAMGDALSEIRDGTRIVSICTGGFTLAAAGLLDGRRATTHWECAPLFRSWYPRVQLEENVLFVHDGDVHTSAGAGSRIDPSPPPLPPHHPTPPP